MRFKDLIYSEPMNTDNVKRYQTIYLTKDDTLNDHIVHVMMMGYMFISETNRKLDTGLFSAFDIGKYLEKCLVHDIPEVVTSDIIRSVKYHTEEIRKEMEKISLDVASRLCDRYFDDRTYCIILNDKDDTPEGLLLRVFDMLDVARLVLVEYQMHSNKEVVRAAIECSKYLTVLRDTKLMPSNVKDIVPEQVRVDLYNLVYDAIVALEDIVTKNKDIISDYGMSRRVFL